MPDSYDVDNELVTVSTFVFPSSHYAFQAEEICQDADLQVLLIPLPREISSDCGVALVFDPQLQQQIAALLEQAGVLTSGCYQVTRERKRARLWQRVLGI